MGVLQAMVNANSAYTPSRRGLFSANAGKSISLGLINDWALTRVKVNADV